MGSPTLLLAQTATDESTRVSVSGFLRTTISNMDILHHPDLLLDSLKQAPILLSSVLVTLGVLCVLNGYRWHRWVVIVLAFLCGLGLGELLSDRFGRSGIVAVALGALCAIIATPLEKIAVAIFGGLAGAFIGANVWTALNTDSANLHWAGAAMGFIALAMASLVLSRLVIVLFTSVGGAAMVVFGAIALLLNVEGWESAVRTSLSAHELLIPMLVTLAAVGGFVLQEGRSRAATSEE